MSSVLRSTAQLPRLQSKFFRIESPCYFDNVLGLDLLFPFTFRNGVLDIAYIDNFKVDMVDSTGNNPASEADGNVRLMGGTELVTDLGENFKAYITAWKNPDAGTPISIHTKGVVQKVQMSLDGAFLNTSAFCESSQAPPSDDYITGDASNSYRTTWVFKTPLTFSVVVGGTTTYITFTTRFDWD